MSRKYTSRQFVDPKGIIVEGKDGTGLLAHGVTVPSSVSGYSSGCIFMDTDASAGSQVYINEGTSSSCTFVALQSATTGTFTTIVNTAINAAAAAATLTIKANTAAAWSITDATTAIVTVDSRNTITGVIAVKVNASAPTIAGAAGSTFSQFGVAAKTITTSTQTTITALDGLGATIGAQTVAQTGGAVTVTTASALYVSKVVAGSSVTITNNYIVNTDQAGCFCTAGGVWTDTASTQRVKLGIQDCEADSIKDILGKLRPRTWKYNPEEVGHDYDRQRFGIVSEELPDCFRIPGVTNDQGGLNGSILGSFSLAALKFLWDRNQELESRLANLEMAK